MAKVHHTKDKGDRAVAHVHADLTDRGFVVLFPATEHASFDLVAYDHESFLRIQVKFRAMTKGVISVELRSGWSDRTGVHHIPMDRSEVDVLAIFCPDTRQTYYVDPGRHGGSVTLRMEPPANNQKVGVLLASDHLDMPPLPAA